MSNDWIFFFFLVFQKNKRVEKKSRSPSLLDPVLVCFSCHSFFLLHRLHDGYWTTNIRSISATKWSNNTYCCFVRVSECWFNPWFSFSFITFHIIFIFGHSFQWTNSIAITTTTTTTDFSPTTNYRSYDQWTMYRDESPIDAKYESNNSKNSSRQETQRSSFLNSV